MTPTEKAAFDAMREAARCTSATIGKEPSGVELPQATAFSPEVMKAAHDSAVQQFGNTSRDLAREKEIATLEAKCKDYEAALNSILLSAENHPLYTRNIEFAEIEGGDLAFVAIDVAQTARNVLAKHGGSK